VRKEGAEVMAYAPKWGAMLHRSRLTDSEVIWDSRQATEADYEAESLILLDVRGQRRAITGDAVRAEFYCFAPGALPWLYVETERPSHFGLDQEQLLLRPGSTQWEAVVLPFRVQSVESDLDGDGALDLLGYIGDETIQECNYAACGNSMRRAIEIPGPVSWDGHRFSATKPGLKPWYEEHYTAALAALGALSTEGTSQCDFEALQRAGEIILYGRILGRPRKEWLDPVDALMQEAYADGCRKGEDENVLSFTPWPLVRASLLATPLGSLPRQP
jgi:hypothetical protein